MDTLLQVEGNATGTLLAVPAKNLGMHTAREGHT
jgi:hypothetical protein